METWTFLLTTLAGLLTVYYFFIQNFNKFNRRGILHIKPIPIFGNMASALMQRRPIVDVVGDAYNLSEDANYVGVYDFMEPVIVIKSPELMKDIAVKSFDHFVDHRGFVSVQQDPLFGRNLFSLKGDAWKEIRSLLTPTFTSSKMKGMFKLMSNCGRSFADYLHETATETPNVLNVKDAFTRYTNDVIASCAFGVTCDSMRNPDNVFYKLGRKTTKMEGLLTLKFFLFSGFPKVLQFLKVSLIDPVASKFFENIVRETIEMRDKDGVTRPDMLQLMMETRNNKTGPRLGVQEMAAQAFGFFFAAFDSSSAFMCFLSHELAVNEDIQTKVQDEIDAVLEATNGEVTYDAINAMEYLDAVIHEGLRKYPGAPFLDRRCVKSYQMPPPVPGGKPIVIEPGTIIWFPLFAVHRDPKYYPEPEKFDPERFLGERKSKIDPFTFFPFGQGPRMCIGYRFALLESKVVFFNLLAKCNLRRSPKTVVPLKLGKDSFGLTAEGGYWLQIETRKGYGNVNSLDSSKQTNGFAKSS